MSNYDKLSPEAMLEYIKETPAVLHRILEERKTITADFVRDFAKHDYQKLEIIGSGTSYHGGLSVRSFMERTLGINVDVNYPMLYREWAQVFNQPTAVIGISQGGESKSTISGLVYAKAHGCRTFSLAQEGRHTKLAAQADIPLQISCGEELAGPKTKGYQATMLTLVLLAAETALALKRISDSKYALIITRLEKTIENLAAVIDQSISWYERNREAFKSAKRIIVVGYQANYGNVLEGRLKLEEAIRFGVEGYELEEFMHGIYHSIDEGVHLIHLASAGEYQPRIKRLRDFMTPYSEHQYLIGSFTETEQPKGLDLNGHFIDDPDFAVFEYIIPLQCVAFFLSRDLGINANIPKIINFHYLMGSK
ncbi:MAG: SIS domain-containing protein [Erysipelotrichaceae bacterium]|nr:SIS domain-containing protein [Erysipelotrichaceae bacterium]